MRINRTISFLIAFTVVFSSIVMYPNYTFSEKGGANIPLLTFVNRRDDVGISTDRIEGDNYNEVQVNEVFVEPGLLGVGDRISIDLPGLSRHIAIIDKVDVDINGVYTVRGRLDKKEYGYFLISSKDNISSGLINLVEDREKYLINYDNEKGIHYMFLNAQDDMDIIPSNPLIPPMEDLDFNDEIDLKPLAVEDLNELVTIDLMLVYTADAMEEAKYWGGIDNVIAQAMANSQLVLDNSKVNINLRLVHSSLVQYQEHGWDIGIDLERLTDKSDGYMDGVHELRDTYGADLVSLITYGTGGGIGWLLSNETGNPDHAFTVSGISQFYSGITLIHEIGHNMGAHHSRNQYSQTAPANGGLFQYSTGWRWDGSSGTSYSSIMTYPEGSTRVPVFSNPDVLWDRVPTGSYSGRFSPADNARTLRETKHVIANYRNKKVNSVPIKSITLNKTKMYLYKNKKEKLEVTIIPYIHSDEIRWSSSNPSVAKVDSQGNVTGLSKGTTTISVTTNGEGKVAYCDVVVEDDIEIVFPDKNLENEIRKIINKTIGGILRSDVIDIEELYLFYAKISNAEGLQYFRNLLSLYISGNEIEDLTPLSNLIELRKLSISGSKITDASQLKNLINLEQLYLINNQISEMPSLSNFVKLTRLNLSYNELKDVKGLSNLPNLEDLDITHNRITDISYLNNLPKLFSIDLSYNELTKIKGVNNLVSLVHLNITNNSIDDISPLSSLANLESLNISKNNISNIDPLNSLIKMRYLDLSNNVIINIGSLEYLQFLNSVSLNNNMISNLYPLRNKGNDSMLSKLDLSNNNIVDISPLIINLDNIKIFNYTYFYLSNNYLNITEGSRTMKDIQKLTDKGFKVSYQYQKQIITVNEIELTKSNLVLEIGQEEKLNVTISPSDATNQDVVWASSDNKIVKVDNSGNLTAVSKGQATITVISADGAKKAGCKVTVVKGFEIWKDKLTKELSNHSWEVKFNLPINTDEDNVNNSTVYIIDEDSNKLNFINARAENDEEFGYIVLYNNGAFEENKSYWIIIEDTVKSIDNKELRKTLKIQFTIEP